MTARADQAGQVVPAAARPPSELTGLVQPLRLAVRLPGLLLRGPRGDGGRVLVLPGRSFGDLTTLPLRAFLRAKGHRPVGWAQGRNRHPVPSMVGPMVERIERIGGTGEPWAIVGQSLGGYLGREVARHRPDLVRQVVTIGSPIFDASSSAPLTRPVTAIWSAADRVVPRWRSVDREAFATDEVEVRSTHFAMGLDPDVWRTVADQLGDQG